MDSLHLNTFSFDETTKLLNIITSHSLCTPKQDFPLSRKNTCSHIIYIDIDVQQTLIEVLKTFLEDAQTPLPKLSHS